MNQDDAKNTKDVVVGTVLINKMSDYVSFESGATNSFVSKRFTSKLKLGYENLREPLRCSNTCSKNN